MKKLSALWRAIIQHAEELNLVEGPDDSGVLKLQTYALNWLDISHKAESIAPPWSIHQADVPKPIQASEQ